MFDCPLCHLHVGPWWRDPDSSERHWLPRAVSLQTLPPLHHPHFDVIFLTTSHGLPQSSEWYSPLRLWHSGRPHWRQHQVLFQCGKLYLLVSLVLLFIRVYATSGG